MQFLSEGGINHPIATLIILLLFLGCSTAYSLFRTERMKSISATEMHVIDRWISILGICILILFAVLTVTLLS